MNKQDSIKCVCDTCGKESSGMKPGQPHRRCPNKRGSYSPSAGGRNRSGKKLVDGRGTWIVLPEENE